MRVPNRYKRYYQSLRDMNYAVFAFIASIAYSGMYLLIVPLIISFMPKKKKLSHSAWTKWTYMSDSVEDVKKQY